MTVLREYLQRAQGLLPAQGVPGVDLPRQKSVVTVWTHHLGLYGFTKHVDEDSMCHTPVNSKAWQPHPAKAQERTYPAHRGATL